MLLLAGLWPGLAFALALGLGVGWLAGMPRGWAVPLTLACLVLAAVVAALAGPIRGAAGLWIESGAAMLGLYGLGCVLGGLARGDDTAGDKPAPDA